MTAAQGAGFPDPRQQDVAFARGAATALTWSDFRCQCGAGRWGVIDAGWLYCRLCGDTLSVSDIADDVVEDRVPPRNLTTAELPTLGGPE